MKKLLVFLLIGVMTFTLAACGSAPRSNSLESGTGAVSSVTKRSVSSETKKILVVYYSLTGTTRGIANRLQKKVGGELYEIKTVKAYPDNMQEVSDEAKRERRSGNLPELKGKLPDVSGYDLILMGGPVWNGTLAPPLMSFFKQVNLKGKTVAPFWTDTGHPGEYAEGFKSLAVGARLNKMLDLSSVSSDEETDLNQKLDDWLSGLGIVIN